MKAQKQCERCGESFHPPSGNAPGRYCSRACYGADKREGKAGPPPPPPPAIPLDARFWAKLPTERPPDGCWLWAGALDRGGYGVLKLRGRGLAAHRVSWELHHGPIPTGAGYHGTCVLHRCDTPSCVNPRHLFLGSNDDNITDRLRKGRFVRRQPTKYPPARAL